MPVPFTTRSEGLDTRLWATGATFFGVLAVEWPDVSINDRFDPRDRDSPLLAVPEDTVRRGYCGM